MKYNRNKVNAIKLMGYLVSRKAQKIYAEVNFKFLIMEDVKNSDFIEKYFQSLKAAQLFLTKIVTQQKKLVFWLMIK